LLNQRTTPPPGPPASSHQPTARRTQDPTAPRTPRQRRTSSTHSYSQPSRTLTACHRDTRTLARPDRPSGPHTRS
jgi:hypothetical protein